MSYYDNFKNIIKSSMEYVNDNAILEIVDVFFIEIVDYDLFQYIDKSLIKNYILRDTMIYKKYNKYNNTNKEYLLCYSLVNILNNFIKINTSNIDLIKNGKLLNDLKNYITKIDIKFSYLVQLYEKLYEKYTIINYAYQKLINEKKKILTIVKERRDTEISNPRYDIKFEDNYINLKYINVDSKFSTDNISGINKNKKIANINVDSTSIENYYFGKFDKTYDKYASNKNISDDCYNMIFEKLFDNNDDICFIGYGQSGSGKTSTLLYLNNKENPQDGILLEFFKHPHFLNNLKINKIKISVKNIYFKLDNVNINNIKIEDYDVNEIGKDEFTYNNNNWYSTNGRLGKIINDILEKRQVDPTTNNPLSSRSHVVMCFTLYTGENNTLRQRNIILCDLAGVENKFNCDNINEIINFDMNYRKYNDNLKDYLIKYTKKLKNDPIKTYTDKLNELKKNIVNKIKIIENNTNIDYFNSYDAFFNLKNSNGFKNTYNNDNTNINDIKTRILNDIELNMNIIEKFIDNDNIYVYNIIKNNKDDDMLIYHKELIIQKLALRSVDKEAINLYLINVHNNNTSDKYFSKKFKKSITLENLKKYFQDNNIKYKIDDSFIYKNLDNNEKYDDYVSNVYNKKLEINKNLDEKFKLFFDFINENFNKNVNNNITIKKNTNKTNQNNNNTVNNTLTNETPFIEIKNKIIDIDDKEKDMGKKMNNVYIKKILDLFKKIVNLYNDLFIIYFFYDNCNIRTKEGYFINKSLYDMKDVIISLIKSSIKIDNNYLPIYFDKEIHPYCRNIILNHDTIDTFYNNNNNNNLSSIILETIKNFIPATKQELNLKFVILTVINTTFNDIINNPPNPPYINVNNLYYYNKINYNKNNLLDELKNLKNKLNNYNFYKNYVISDDFKFDTNYKDNDLIMKVEKIHKYIYNNNSVSLVGSLETTDSLQSITYNNIACSYNNKLIEPVIEYNIPVENDKNDKNDKKNNRFAPLHANKDEIKNFKNNKNNNNNNNNNVFKFRLKFVNESNNIINK